METLIAILIIVFAVLQVVLFFKLWVATNDIRKIMKTITEKSDNPMRPDLLEECDEELYLGNKDKALEILKRAQYKLENSLKTEDDSCPSHKKKTQLNIIKTRIKKLSQQTDSPTSTTAATAIEYIE